MASRYKLISGDLSFTYQGETVRAGIDGWLRPTSAAMELAMIEAGALPAGAVAAEDALGKAVVSSAAAAPVMVNKATGLIDDPAGAAAVRGAAVNRWITNAAGLRPAIAALMSAVSSDQIITLQGDSLTQLGGDTVNQSSDQLAEIYGFGAALRREINARLGLSSFDGGQWCPPDASPSDTRVANAGSPTLVANYGPQVSYRDSSSTQQMRKPVSLDGAGKSVTYTVTGRYLKVVTWENAANSYNGTFSYQIDGGSVTNVVSTGLTDTYRIITIDLGTQAAHTVVLSWVSNKVLVAGAMVTNGRGVSTARFGVGGSTTYDMANANERVVRTTFKTLPSALQIIRYSYNDWQKQATGPFNTTPEAFASNLQTLITAAQANSATKGVLLMCDPATSTADSLPRLYAEYTAAAKSLATGSVAFFDCVAAMDSFATQNANGYYVDFVHKTASGHAVDARVLASLLLDPYLIGT